MKSMRLFVLICCLAGNTRVAFSLPSVFDLAQYAVAQACNVWYGWDKASTRTALSCLAIPVIGYCRYQDYTKLSYVALGFLGISVARYAWNQCCYSSWSEERTKQRLRPWVTLQCDLIDRSDKIRQERACEIRLEDQKKNSLWDAIGASMYPTNVSKDIEEKGALQTLANKESLCRLIRFRLKEIFKNELWKGKVCEFGGQAMNGDLGLLSIVGLIEEEKNDILWDHKSYFPTELALVSQIFDCCYAHFEYMVMTCIYGVCSMNCYESIIKQIKPLSAQIDQLKPRKYIKYSDDITTQWDVKKESYIAVRRKLKDCQELLAQWDKIHKECSVIQDLWSMVQTKYQENSLELSQEDLDFEKNFASVVTIDRGQIARLRLDLVQMENEILSWPCDLAIPDPTGWQGPLLFIEVADILQMDPARLLKLTNYEIHQLGRQLQLTSHVDKATAYGKTHLSPAESRDEFTLNNKVADSLLTWARSMPGDVIPEIVINTETVETSPHPSPSISEID